MGILHAGRAGDFPDFGRLNYSGISLLSFKKRAPQPNRRIRRILSAAHPPAVFYSSLFMVSRYSVGLIPAMDLKILLK